MSSTEPPGTRAVLTGNARRQVTFLIRAARFDGFLGHPGPGPGFPRALVELLAAADASDNAREL